MSAENAEGLRATLCAIMKDEAPYILEWVAYHRLIGIDEIVIYSNDCSDGSVALLDRLARSGAVEHRVAPTPKHIGPQVVAYNDALQKCRTPWMAFLDADEFLALKRDETVSDYLSRFGDEVSGVAVNWRLFGSSGEKTIRPGLVVERFVRASETENALNRHVKSLVRVRSVDFMRIHAAQLCAGAYVDSAGRPAEIVDDGLIDRVDHELAQINHYCVKSEQEFVEKKRRGVATSGKDDPMKFNMRDGADWFAAHDRNEEEDLSLFAFRHRIREEIERLKQIPGAHGASDACRSDLRLQRLTDTD